MDPIVAVGNLVLNMRRFNYLCVDDEDAAEIKVTVHFAPCEPVELRGDAARALLSAVLNEATRLTVTPLSVVGGKPMPPPPRDNAADPH